MKIFINENPIDFRLQEEKNLGEVLIGLTNWIREQKYFINEVRVNDERVEIESLSQKKRSLKEIKTLHCEVFSSVAYAVSVWSELRLHFEPFKNITTEIINEKIDDITDRLEWIKEIINKLDKFFGTPNESQNLIKNIKALELAIFKAKTMQKPIGSEIKTLFNLIEDEIEEGLFKLNLKILKVGLKKDIASIRYSIENYIIFLELIDEKLLQIATDFQKSNLKSAFQGLSVISDGIGIFFVLNHQIDDDLISQIKKNKSQRKKSISLEKKARKKYADFLKSFLETLDQALKDNDYIDAADIIEYEIKEIIPPLRDTLGKVLISIDEILKPINNK